MSDSQNTWKSSISRRQLIYGTATTLGLLTSSKLLASCQNQETDSTPLKSTQQSSVTPKKFNIVAIIVDDLRPQLGCYGRQETISPNIDQLAKSGTLFERTYCQVPICGASRASFLSGIRASRQYFNSAYDARKDRDAPDFPSLPFLLKQSGYHSISLGKVYHVPDDDSNAWTEKPWRPWGFLGAEQYATQENQKLAQENSIQQGLGKPFELVDVADNVYADGKIADQAIQKLKHLSQQEQPFFAAFGFSKPHLPFTAPLRYWEMYDREKIDLADNPFRSKGAPDNAFSNWGELRNYVGIPKEGALTDEMARTLIHGYYASTTYVDAQIGRVLKALKRFNLQDNTIVVLWGDHGWHLGEHGLWCKHTNFETALHSPLILRVPTVQAGQRVTGLTEFVDIYPTLCDLCGLEKPEHLQGDSLIPLLNNPQHKWKSAAFSYYRSGNSMKTDQYRYTEWTDKQGKQVARMLFDHQADPHENVNIAENSEHQELVKTLSQQLDNGQGWKKLRSIS